MRAAARPTGPRTLAAVSSARVNAAGSPGGQSAPTAPSAVSERGCLDGPQWSRPADVTYLTTCCLLVSRRALAEVGLFDATYFINVDDADWCRRALDQGFSLRYVPESRIWHKVAASTAGSYTPVKTFHTGRSNALYVRRHGGALGLASFLAANLVTLPAAFLRELPRGNGKAALAKARGVLCGLTDPLPAPPRL